MHFSPSGPLSRSFKCLSEKCKTINTAYTNKSLGMYHFKMLQERQCMHTCNTAAHSWNSCCCGKAALRILLCVSAVLSYPAWKVHVLYCIVTCGLSGSTIFFPPIISEMTHFFWKESCFFSYKFCWIISHSKKPWVRYMHAFMWSTHYSCQLLMELEFSHQIV
jgi:hypothetical protein